MAYVPGAACGTDTRSRTAAVRDGAGDARCPRSLSQSPAAQVDDSAIAGWMTNEGAGVYRILASRNWHCHFRSGGPRPVGQTAMGRATVATLRIHRDCHIAYPQELMDEECSRLISSEFTRGGRGQTRLCAVKRCWSSVGAIPTRQLGRSSR